MRTAHMTKSGNLAINYDGCSDYYGGALVSGAWFGTVYYKVGGLTGVPVSTAMAITMHPDNMQDDCVQELIDSVEYNHRPYRQCGHIVR